MKKLLSVLLAMVIAMSFLTGCVKSNEPEKDADPTPTPAPTPASLEVMNVIVLSGYIFFVSPLIDVL